MSEIGRIKTTSGIPHQVQTERKLPPGLAEQIPTALETLQASAPAYKNATGKSLKGRVKHLKKPPFGEKIQGPATNVPPKGNVSAKKGM